MEPTRYRRTCDPELVQVQDELAGHPERERFAFDPLWLVELGQDLPQDELPPGGFHEVGAPRARRLSQLRRELAHVQRRELARLCRAAAALRIRATDLSAGSPAALPALDVDELRACLREELELVDLILIGDELCPAALLEVPRRCLGPDPASWPSATALAAVSLFLAPHELGRLRLGQALVAAGAAHAAARVFAAALARGPSRRGERLLRLGLGRARRRSGQEGRER
jgi:hypothetical protein